MAQHVLPEYSGEDLIYTGALGVVQKLGYDFWHERQPEEERYSREISERVPEQDGPVAEERREFPDRATATRQIKEWALGLGADMVGVTRVDPYYVYKDKEVPHSQAPRGTLYS